MATSELSIRPARASDLDLCARMMATSEPWLTLGRGYKASRKMLADRTREIYVGEVDSRLAGFVVLCVTGAFVGYIQTVCVAPDCRGKGIGTALITFAERRIFRDSPNVFLCVSSFNPGAQRLYARLGYAVIGELPDYLVRGHSEFLLRKSLGPIDDFQKRLPESSA